MYEYVYVDEYVGRQGEKNTPVVCSEPTTGGATAKSKLSVRHHPIPTSAGVSTGVPRRAEVHVTNENSAICV